MTEFIEGDLHHLRNLLNHSFHRLSSKDGIKINPKKDTSVLDVCDRLYDEERLDRRIYIDFNPGSGLELDWFVKKFLGRNGELLLLTISIDGSAMDAQKLWNIYKAWIHDRVDAERAVRS